MGFNGLRRNISIFVTSVNPSTYGQNITFSVPVNTGGTLPTGTITFKDGGSSIGTGSVTPVNPTNELRYSTNFGAWGTNSGVTITPNATTAPDGSNTATLLTVGSGGQYYILDSFPCSAGVTTYSAWIMQGPNPSAFLVFTMRFSDASGNNIYTGFPGATIPASWTRESFTATAPAGTASCGIGLEQNGASGGGGTALPGQNVYARGAQTEAASQPGPYISTNGSSASGYGGFASFTTSTLAAGTHPITAVYGGDANTLPSASSALAQVVNLGTPVVTTWPTASPINFGQTLASSTLSGGTASVAGTFSWTTPSTAPPLGTAPQSVTFTPTNTTDYNNVTGTASVTVNKQTQTITFPAPASPVIYGVAPIALSATASSGLPVTFTVISGPGTTSGSMGEHTDHHGSRHAYCGSQSVGKWDLRSGDTSNAEHCGEPSSSYGDLLFNAESFHLWSIRNRDLHLLWFGCDACRYGHGQGGWCRSCYSHTGWLWRNSLHNGHTRGR
jgi:hypothetical protein